jgi:hypothetical protein
MVEWSVVAALILVLAVVFMHRVRVVQRQAELAAVRSTLGALRTAFVFQHLQSQAQHASKDAVVAVMHHNPFELLKQRPGNYWGEVTSSTALALPSGNWVFDSKCECMGYLPQDATEFDTASGDSMAWFHVSAAANGLLQITAREAYVWQGVVLN